MSETIPISRYQDNSTAAMVLGICSIFPFVGIVTAILAIIFGNSTLKGISAGDVPPESRGKAQAGKILGIVLGILALVSSGIIVWGFLSYEDETCYRLNNSGRIVCVRDGSL